MFYCEFCETFKNNYFHRTPLDDCFWNFKIQFLRRIKWFLYRLKNEWTLTQFIVFVHKCWGNWNFSSDIKFSLPAHTSCPTIFLGHLKSWQTIVIRTSKYRYVRLFMAEMESSKIIDEANLFCNISFHGFGLLCRFPNI